jgi:hypothetical protein
MALLYARLHQHSRSFSSASSGLSKRREALDTVGGQDLTEVRGKEIPRKGLSLRWSANAVRHKAVEARTPEVVPLRSLKPTPRKWTLENGMEALGGYLLPILSSQRVHPPSDRSSGRKETYLRVLGMMIERPAEM